MIVDIYINSSLSKLPAKILYNQNISFHLKKQKTQEISNLNGKRRESNWE